MHYIIVTRAQDAMVDRDEVESSVQKRGDGTRQRVLTLAAELREEKALTAKLRAASEEGGTCGLDDMASPHRVDYSTCHSL